MPRCPQQLQATREREELLNRTVEERIARERTITAERLAEQEKSFNLRLAEQQKQWGRTSEIAN